MTTRVTNPAMIEQLAAAVGAQVSEAVRWGSRTGSTFRVWTADRRCFEVQPSQTFAARALKAVTGRLMFRRAVRRPAFDRPALTF